jgi:hypothetical protein
MECVMFIPVVSFLLGVIFGTSFRIWAILPASLAVFSLGSGLQFYSGSGLPSAAACGIADSFALQLGYLACLFMTGSSRSSKNMRIDVGPDKTSLAPPNI